MGLVPAFRPTEPIGWRGRLHGELGLLSLSLSLSLSLPMKSTYACLPPLWSPLWQAIDASNEPAAHCGLGQMLWERTAFPSTPHRSAPEEATARLAIVSKSP